MEFTEQEVAFLLKPHKLEVAALGGSRMLSAARDLRALGCPTPIFNRVLESRAKKLGSKFTEFHNQQHTELAPSVPAFDLESTLAADRLF